MEDLGVITIIFGNTLIEKSFCLPFYLESLALSRVDQVEKWRRCAIELDTELDIWDIWHISQTKMRTLIMTAIQLAQSSILQVIIPGW